MNIIIWLISFIVFTWCYSTIFNCLINLRYNKVLKISLIVYITILCGLYAISYFLLSKYFNEILICSIISGVLGILTIKKEN